MNIHFLLYCHFSSASHRSHKGRACIFGFFYVIPSLTIRPFIPFRCHLRNLSTPYVAVYLKKWKSYFDLFSMWKPNNGTLFNMHDLGFLGQIIALEYLVSYRPH